MAKPTNRARRKAPSVAAPDCPAWLDAEAQAEWARVVPELVEAGVLARVDRAALAAYCQSWAELVTCTELLRRDGRFITTPIQNAKGEVLGEKVVPHPALAAQRDALGRVRTYLVEFALTPAARLRMKFAEDEAVGASDIMSMLAGK